METKKHRLFGEIKEGDNIFVTAIHWETSLRDGNLQYETEEFTVETIEHDEASGEFSMSGHYPDNTRTTFWFLPEHSKKEFVEFHDCIVSVDFSTKYVELLVVSHCNEVQNDIDEYKRSIASMELHIVNCKSLTTKMKRIYYNNDKDTVMKYQFTITGEFITGFARDKYRDSKNIEAGIRFLQEALPGMPADMASDIVSGKKMLTGSNDDIYLEDDDTEVIPKMKPISAELAECGWIAPDGRIFGYSSYSQRDDHDNLAQQICENGYVDFTPNGDILTTYIAVENAGWIKFTLETADSFCKPAMITTEQKNSLVDILKKHGVKKFQIGHGKEESNGYSPEQISNMDTLMFGIKINSK